MKITIDRTAMAVLDVDSMGPDLLPRKDPLCAIDSVAGYAWRNVAFELATHLARTPQMGFALSHVSQETASFLTEF